MSRDATVPTTCHRCRNPIPPMFLRVTRTDNSSGVNVERHFHANYNCLRDFREEIRDAPDIRDLTELSEQEKRVVNALVDMIDRSGDHRELP